MIEKIARTPKEWRARLNLSQEFVADKLGVRRTTYANWEQKPEKMKIQDGIKLAEVFECEFSEIFFWTVS